MKKFLKSVDAFYNTNHEYNVNKLYTNHKDIYIRFAIQFLVMETTLSVIELYNELEKQYVEEEEHQYPVIENEQFLIIVPKKTTTDN